MGEIEDFTKQLKDIKEIHGKSRASVITFSIFGGVLFLIGAYFMYLVYLKDHKSIKLVTVLPITLIMLGIDIVKNAYRDS